MGPGRHERAAAQRRGPRGWTRRRKHPPDERSYRQLAGMHGVLTGAVGRLDDSRPPGANRRDRPGPGGPHPVAGWRAPVGTAVSRATSLPAAVVAAMTTAIRQEEAEKAPAGEQLARSRSAAGGGSLACKLAAAAALLGVVGLFALAMVAATLARPPQQAGGAVYGVSSYALADIPHDYLVLYQQAGEQYGIDWAILAGIGKEETDHGRLQAAGVTIGANFLGCCGGPMQFFYVPYSGRLAAHETNTSTWGTESVDGNGDGIKDVWDPADAIPRPRTTSRTPARPRTTRPRSGPTTTQTSLPARHRYADRYRGTLTGGPAEPLGSGLPSGVTLAPGANRPGVQETPAFMAFAGEIAKVLSDGRPLVITTGTNHSQMTLSGNVSDHWAGNAADFGMGANGFSYDCRGCRGEKDRRRCPDRGGRSTAACARPRSSRRRVHRLPRGPTRAGDLAFLYRGDHFNHVHTGVGQC